MRRVHGWRAAAWLAVLVFVVAGRLEALEKPTRAQLEQYRSDGTLAERVSRAKAIGNDRIDPALVLELQNRLRRLQFQVEGQAGTGQILPVLPPGIRPGLAAKGTSRIFALLIDFYDYPASVPAGSVNTALFADGAGGAPYESLRNYYRRASYNQLEIQGATLGYYRPAYPRSSVSQTWQGREGLIEEALTYFDSLGHDFSQYDNNGDGIIDYFCVFWTGPDNGWANFWWGYYTGWSSWFALDGKQFSGCRYSWQWVKSASETTFSPRTVIHETGHSLGLPDLYDYDGTLGPDGGTGGLDMMDGNWGDHNGFSKMLLGWLTPRVAAAAQVYSLQPSGTSPDAVIMWPGYSLANPFTEFFMIQNRSRVGNDITYPTDGLVIWHVDARLDNYGDFAWDNSYAPHKLVRLMEADGLEHIERGYSAHSADFYVPGTMFGNETVPNSRAYDGSLTLVGAQRITRSGTTMTFTAGDTSPRLATDVQTVAVSEGGSGTLMVKLTAWPVAPVTVTVARVSGDADLSVQSAPLTFTVGNWNTWQPVTLAAAEDSDRLNGTATIRLSAAGLPSVDRVAVEVDNDVPWADFNADGFSDIVWWDRATDETSVWVMSGAAKAGELRPFQWCAYPYQPAAIADFDLDGLPDVIWRSRRDGSNLLVYGAGSASPRALDPVGDLSWNIVAAADFNGDGWPDIAWRNGKTGEVAIWFMRSSAYLGYAPVGTVADARWEVVAAADFNGDRRADLLWHNEETGQVLVWFLNGAAYLGFASVTTVADTDWHVAGAGDFNADGQPDLLWRNLATGANKVDYLAGETVVGSALLPGMTDPDWTTVGLLNHTGRGPGDFNADRVPDILWHNRVTGQNTIWYMGGSDGSARLAEGLVPAAPTLDWTSVAVADFNGDALPDIVWRNTATGENRIWLMTGRTKTGEMALPTIPDPDWHIVGVGDFNQDGHPDLAWRNYATGDNIIWFLQNGVYTGWTAPPTIADTDWHIVAVGDFNGDGWPDLLWRNHGTGADAGKNIAWFLVAGVYAGWAAPYAISDPDWQIVGASDYDRDGKADLLWRNASTGENLIWYLVDGNYVGWKALPTLDVAWATGAGQ